MRQKNNTSWHHISVALLSLLFVFKKKKVLHSTFTKRCMRRISALGLVFEIMKREKILLHIHIVHKNIITSLPRCSVLHTPWIHIQSPKISLLNFSAMVCFNIYDNYLEYIVPITILWIFAAVFYQFISVWTFQN